MLLPTKACGFSRNKPTKASSRLISAVLMPAAIPARVSPRCTRISLSMAGLSVADEIAFSAGVGWVFSACCSISDCCSCSGCGAGLGADAGLATGLLTGLDTGRSCGVACGATLGAATATGATVCATATPGGSSNTVYSRNNRPEAQFSSTSISRNGSLIALLVVTFRT